MVNRIKTHHYRLVSLREARNLERARYCSWISIKWSSRSSPYIFVRSRIFFSSDSFFDSSSILRCSNRLRYALARSNSSLSSSMPSSASSSLRIPKAVEDW